MCLSKAKVDATCLSGSLFTVFTKAGSVTRLELNDTASVAS